MTEWLQGDVVSVSVKQIVTQALMLFISSTKKLKITLNQNFQGERFQRRHHLLRLTSKIFQHS